MRACGQVSERDGLRLDSRIIPVGSIGSSEARKTSPPTPLLGKDEGRRKEEEKSCVERQF
jgi:hypothetical protein